MLARNISYKLNAPKDAFISDMFGRLKDRFVVTQIGDLFVITSQKSYCHIHLKVLDTFILLKWFVPFYYKLLKILIWILLLIYFEKKIGIIYTVLLPGMAFLILWDVAGNFIFRPRIKKFIHEIELSIRELN